MKKDSGTEEEKEDQKAEETAKGPTSEGEETPAAEEEQGKNAEFLKAVETMLNEGVAAHPEFADAAKWAMEYLGKYEEMEMAQEKAKADSDANAKLQEVGKGITAARVAELKAAYNHFGELLTTIGAIKAEAEEETEEETKEKEKAAVLGETLGAEVAKAMAPIAASLKELNTRIETVEKTRGASRSEGDDTPVQKGKKENIWGGLL